MSDGGPPPPSWSRPGPPPPAGPAPGGPAGWSQHHAPGFAPPGGVPAPVAFGPGYASAQGLATSSMVLGIVALCTVWCPFLAPVLAVIGIPLGGVALGRIKRGDVIPAGRGQAIAGVVMGSIALVLSILFVILILVSDG